MMEIMIVMHEKFSGRDYEIWLIMAWQLWTHICKLTHGDDGGKNEVVSEETCEAQCEAYQQARTTVRRENHLGFEVGAKKWIRPRQGTFRADVDALFCQESRSFGVGVIVRDHDGRVAVALSKTIAPPSNGLMAEVSAVVHGIALCIEHEVSPVEIYTDSCLAARLLGNPEEEENLIPADVRETMAVARMSCLVGVYHMYRSANYVAHSLAQFARNCPRPRVWTGLFPSWLEDIVNLILLLKLYNIFFPLKKKKMHELETVPGNYQKVMVREIDMAIF